MEKERQYIAIDLKSFYASVECVERGLDPLTASLVVADEGRTDKTICLAVSPSLKERGISGRARLFEVLQKVRRDEFVCAVPRMQLYVDYSVRIYKIYLKYVAPEDIHVYSIDEVFIDVTGYLDIYKMTAHELAMKMIKDVLKQTGITATAGIGTNLYLCKIAMDIVAKHMPADCDGVRIAELDEMSYRRLLWSHKPLTSFWRIGKGIAKKLNRCGMYTMGDVARQSLRDEDVLYSLFGVNAELIIDHAWGWEPCTMDIIKRYRPSAKSLSRGQVLSSPYDYKKARNIVKEMSDELALELISKRLATNQIVLTISYDKESMAILDEGDSVSRDYYGRKTPKHAHGTHVFTEMTSSTIAIRSGFLAIYDKVVNPRYLVRRMSLTANNVLSEDSVAKQYATAIQLGLFDDEENKENGAITVEKEKRIQKTVLEIKKRFGKNAINKGMNFADGATMRERNNQIGGHRA